MNSPKSKKAKKKDEPSQDDIISPKTKSVKKPKESFEKKVVSPKTNKVIKSEEPSEEEIGAPKPKKMKKEMNGDIGEKSSKLKNGLPHSGPASNSSEESNSELEQVKLRFFMWTISFIVASVGNCYPDYLKAGENLMC